MIEQYDPNLPLEDWLKQKPDFNLILERVIKNPMLISDLLDIIENNQGTLKFTCMKVIQVLCHEHPQSIYPYFDRIARLIRHPNNFIRWGALLALPDLAKIDDGRKFPEIFEDYLDLIHDPSMITAGNAVKGTGALLRFYPEKSSAILAHLLRVEDDTYLHKGEASPECHHIMIGHVINHLDANYGLYPSKAEIHAFVLRQLDNPRKLVAKKARDFLNRHAL